MSRTAKILGVLGALVLAFVCAVAFLVWSIDPVRGAHRFYSSVKRNVNPEELRAWAAGLAANAPNQRITSINQLPASLQPLSAGFESGGVAPANSSNGWVLTLMYGGGFFHYGMEIGSTNFVDSSDDQLTVIPWVPGIYFKHEGRRK